MIPILIYFIFFNKVTRVVISLSVKFSFPSIYLCLLLNSNFNKFGARRQIISKSESLIGYPFILRDIKVSRFCGNKCLMI